MIVLSVQLTVSFNFTRFAHLLLSRHCGHLGADKCEPLSITLCGIDPYYELVPGCTKTGKMEPVQAAPRFRPDNEAEKREGRTVATLMLKRDPDTSSSNSVQCLNSLALDTPHYAPLIIYWEVSDAPQGLAKHERIENIIPKFIAECDAVKNEKLISQFDVRTANVCYLLNGSEDATDFGGLEEPIASVKYEYGASERAVRTPKGATTRYFRTAALRARIARFAIGRRSGAPRYSCADIVLASNSLLQQQQVLRCCRRKR